VLTVDRGKDDELPAEISPAADPALGRRHTEEGLTLVGDAQPAALRAPEIKLVLDGLVEGASSILQGNFVGAWLQGSSATGHFDEHSDLDFAVGIERDLVASEMAKLLEFHPRLYTYLVSGSWLDRP
jgi:predicted nucleotidyltransferase